MRNDLQILENAISNVTETLDFLRTERENVLLAFKSRAGEAGPESMGSIIHCAEEVRYAHEKVLRTEEVLANLISVREKIAKECCETEADKKQS